MTTPPEVLAAMRSAMLDTCQMPLPPRILAALAAAEALGWELRPADEHKRLKERVAQLDEPYVDDRGEHWIAPTAFAYAAVCRALRECKAELGAARAGAEAAGVLGRCKREHVGR